MLVMLSTGPGSDKHQFCMSLVWLDRVIKLLTFQLGSLRSTDSGTASSSLKETTTHRWTFSIADARLVGVIPRCLAGLAGSLFTVILLCSILGMHHFEISQSEPCIGLWCTRWLTQPSRYPETKDTHWQRVIMRMDKPTMKTQPQILPHT